MWYIIRTPPWYVDNTYIRILYTLHQNEDIFYCGADFYCRTDFFSTLKPRLVEHTADVYCRTDFNCGTDGTDLGGGMYQLETRFARIIRYEYSLYVLQSRASRSRCSIPGISGRVDMLTSPVPAARAAVATGAWVESKHDMYLIHTWK